MIRLPVLDVALEGFRLTRERPLTVLVWGLIMTAALGATVLLLAATGAGEALAAFNRNGPSADPQAAAVMLGAAGPGLAITVGVGLLVNAVAYAAVLRGVLEPQRKAFAYLRVGLEELRLLIVLASLAAVGLVALTAVVPALTLLAAPILGAQAGGGLGAPLVLAVAVAIVSYPMVRLSLAPALTQAQGKVAVFRAWPLTAGLFWPLLGANLLAAALGSVVSVLAKVVVTALWALANGSTMAAAVTALQPNLQSLDGALTPGSLASIALEGVTNGYVLAIVAAPAPAALRAIGAGRAA